jgi:hypothetical protein
MELKHIVKRISEGVNAIDVADSHQRANQRSGEFYHNGVPSLVESMFTKKLAEWWVSEHPEDFPGEATIQCEIPYGNIPRAKVDLFFKNSKGEPEWAIEIKRIQFVGNNGKNNDFGLAKVLSPYLKDRSLIHDVHRLAKAQIALKSAAISYGFEYSFQTCEVALQKHPESAETISNIRDVCKKENTVTGEYKLAPMIDMLNEYLHEKKFTKLMISEEFHDAWAHPCGGSGQINAWEVIYS